MTKYKDTKEGQFIYKQVKRIRIEGILCISLGLIYLLFNILEKEAWYMYLVTLALFIFGGYFVYKSYSIKNIKEKVYDYNSKNIDKWDIKLLLF